MNLDKITKTMKKVGKMADIKTSRKKAALKELMKTLGKKKGKFKKKLKEAKNNKDKKDLNAKLAVVMAQLEKGKKALKKLG